MKIKKRHPPVDFQSLTDEDATQRLSAVAPEAAPDLDLAAAVPPIAPPLAEPQSSAPLSPIPPAAELAPANVQIPAPRPEPAPARAVSADLPSAWPIYLAALVVSVLWALAPIAFAFGYRRAVSPFDFDPFALTVLAAMAIGPAAFVWIAAYMIRQGQKLGVEANRAKQLADEMVTPAMAAGARASDVVQSVREEIVRAGAAADEARDTLMALRQALAQESERLIDATASSARTATELTGTLGNERIQMMGLSQTLDAQAGAVADAITKQARMVAEASDLAETQLREAEAALAARAADLAAAAGEASDAARTAGEDLTRHISRLETAGVGVSDQIRGVEQGLTEQRAGLVTVAHALRADQEAFGAQSETHAAQLSEFITQARLSTAEMGDRAVKGGEALRELIAEAAEQFRELAESAKAERDEFGQSTLHSMEAVSQAAAEERRKLEEQTRASIQGLGQAAEETRKAAEAHAVTAREQVDQLSEAAFSAGQKANQVFEQRLAEARDLIERSAQMVEQAGAATARKLEEGAVAARATLDELAGMMADIEARATRLPAAARGQAEEVRQAVADSIEDLLEQARRTSDETQAIDAAFQDRVRRNYEMLSDAVRLMGTVAGGAGSVAPPQPAQMRERIAAPARASRRREPEPEPETLFADIEEDEDDDALELTQPVEPEPPARRSRAPEPLPEPELPPRRRLRLTPTATDEEFSNVFEQAGGRPPAAREPAPAAEDASDEWTWKDLLSSIDEGGAPGKPGLEQVLAAEVAAMGIDPVALLPRGRIDEISAAIQVEDVDGAREVVRKLAPAATRRLARRLFTDETLRRQVVTYLNGFQDMLDDAAARDHQGFEVSQLLASDAGRTYLLFDAAAGDLV
ncbi:polar localization protein TipN [Phenylobacterium sp. 20VBR1]|uniref:Polar localization protein TipN n=1 Tax=Phenylobacterium glaciei TaxID=2803784 RepID=A0A941D1B9_9CAUL|nr:polar localization protein TipN [Phenylobacterium glaciei]MBR7620465.1 polar localization protein TipN [Phenylobacterium glaciei]